MAIGIFVTIR